MGVWDKIPNNFACWSISSISQAFQVMSEAALKYLLGLLHWGTVLSWMERLQLEVEPWFMDMTKLKFTCERFSSGGLGIKPHTNATIMCRCSKVSKLLLTGFEQIAVVIKHLQDNAVFPAQEQEGGPGWEAVRQHRLGGTSSALKSLTWSKDYELRKWEAYKGTSLQCHTLCRFYF